MSVHAGTILHVGGSNVIDRIQSAGLGDVNIPIETIREVGNRLVVDKVPGEADFTFSMESLDMGTDLMAFLTGKVGALAAASPPGAADPALTEYKWEDVGYVNITSPWKDPDTGAAGDIVAGHLVPAYLPTRLTYRFGATDNATASVDLAGGEFYYGRFAPVEDFAQGDGTETAFVTSDPTIHYRKGGAAGTDFKDVFGVIVGKKCAVPDVDYVVTGGDGAPATVTFAVPPKATDLVRIAYFTDAAKSYPQTVHADTLIKPGAVRGRNIKVYLGNGAGRARVASIQTVDLEATLETDVERELGSSEIVGRTINGTDCSGTLSVRSKDADALLNLLSKVTKVQGGRHPQDDLRRAGPVPAPWHPGPRQHADRLLHPVRLPQRDVQRVQGRLRSRVGRPAVHIGATHPALRHQRPGVRGRHLLRSPA
jgi:hypothetical protein